MPNFTDPFTILSPDKKMNERELSRALRLSIAAEHDAAHVYESYADACQDEAVRKIFQDIADEEKVHIGEFQKLLDSISGDEEEFVYKGEEEVDSKSEGLDNESNNESDYTEKKSSTRKLIRMALFQPGKVTMPEWTYQDNEEFRARAEVEDPDSAFEEMFREMIGAEDINLTVGREGIDRQSMHNIIETDRDSIDIDFRACDYPEHIPQTLEIDISVPEEMWRLTDKTSVTVELRRIGPGRSDIISYGLSVVSER